MNLGERVQDLTLLCGANFCHDKLRIAMQEFSFVHNLRKQITI